MPEPDDHRIDTIDQLRDTIGALNPGVEMKVYDSLFDEARDYIARSPFIVLATSDAHGNLDASPKGDDPGFVLVEDDQTIVIPDRPGNKLAYGLSNIIHNPHVGVLFLIPGTTETFRVNGRAELRRDPELLDQLAARGKPAILAIRVTVEQCFFHCSKAFLRSKLWKHETWPDKQKISFGQMLAKRIDETNNDLPDVIDAMVEEDYRVNL